MGVRKERLPNPKMYAAQKNWLKGLTDKKNAELLEVSKNTIWRWRKQYHWKKLTGKASQVILTQSIDTIESLNQEHLRATAQFRESIQVEHSNHDLEGLKRSKIAVQTYLSLANAERKWLKVDEKIEEKTEQQTYNPKPLQLMVKLPVELEKELEEATREASDYEKLRELLHKKTNQNPYDFS